MSWVVDGIGEGAGVGLSGQRVSVFTPLSSSRSKLEFQIYSLYHNILIVHLISYLSSIIQIPGDQPTNMQRCRKAIQQGL